MKKSFFIVIITCNLLPVWGCSEMGVVVVCVPTFHFEKLATMHKAIPSCILSSIVLL